MNNRYHDVITGNKFYVTPNICTNEYCVFLQSSYYDKLNENFECRHMKASRKIYDGRYPTLPLRYPLGSESMFVLGFSLSIFSLIILCS